MNISKFQDQFQISLSEAWKDFFTLELKKKYFQDILSHVDYLYHTEEIYPPKHKLWNAFHLTHLEDLKGVLLGQDPYHKKNQACGLSFSVPSAEKIPPSLRNIFAELYRTHNLIKIDGNLEPWACNGILLLNTILTVVPSKPLSHSHLGWQQLTMEIIRYINDYKEHVFFFLFGKNAQKYDFLINDSNKHLIIKTAHPSPLSRKKFIGCNCFKDTDSFCKKHGIYPVFW